MPIISNFPGGSNSVPAHTHAASDISSGALPLSRGGTGATTSAAARTNLNVYSKTEVDNAISTAISNITNGDEVSY